jgi:hypothetical protein
VKPSFVSGRMSTAGDAVDMKGTVSRWLCVETARDSSVLSTELACMLRSSLGLKA